MQHFFSVPSGIMGSNKPNSALRDAIALLLAVRCQQKEACLQILAHIYSKNKEGKAKSLMLKTIMLLEPKERDWLKSLA